jgi:DNA-binding transcriptional ArsR family regulator
VLCVSSAAAWTELEQDMRSRRAGRWHVVVLERAGLVTKRREGREQRVGGNIDTLREAHHLLNQLEAIWRQRLDRIGAILADPPEA